jgi:hypothetical protein
MVAVTSQEFAEAFVPASGMETPYSLSALAFNRKIISEYTKGRYCGYRPDMRISYIYLIHNEALHFARDRD